MGIQVVHEAMRTAKSDVQSASERLAEDRRTEDRRVTAFLGPDGRASLPTRSPTPGETGSRRQTR